MQAAALSHRYASQLASIGVGQSGNPILSCCEHLRALRVLLVLFEARLPKTGRNQEGERVLRCLDWGLVPPFPST